MAVALAIVFEGFHIIMTITMTMQGGNVITLDFIE